MAQEPKHFTTDLDPTGGLDYLLFLPKDYEESRSMEWPLILFLHGSGERGNNVLAVKKHGIPRVVEEFDDFPFIALSPQCPAEETWLDRGDALLALLDEVITNYRVDESRVYLTGLSLGGEGTWNLASQAPHRFAAAIPVCGRSFPDRADRLANLPLWVFHGDNDLIVPFSESEKMVAALQKVGANPKFTAYSGVDHDSWTRTYSNKEIYQWLLSHRMELRSR